MTSRIRVVRIAAAGLLAIALGCTGERAQANLYVPPVNETFHRDLLEEQNVSVDDRWVLDAAHQQHLQGRADLDRVHNIREGWRRSIAPREYETLHEALIEDMGNHYLSLAKDYYRASLTIESEYFATVADIIGKDAARKAQEDWTRQWFLRSSNVQHEHLRGRRFDILSVVHNFSLKNDPEVLKRIEIYRTASQPLIEQWCDQEGLQWYIPGDDIFWREMSEARLAEDRQRILSLWEYEAARARRGVLERFKLRDLNLESGLSIARLLDLRDALVLRAAVLEACCPYLVDKSGAKLPERIMLELLDDHPEMRAEIEPVFHRYRQRMAEALASLEALYMQAHGPDAARAGTLSYYLAEFGLHEEARPHAEELAARRERFNAEVEAFRRTAIAPTLGLLEAMEGGR